MANKIEFKKPVIRAIAPPEVGRATYYDTQIPKLACRVTAAGSKTFYVIKRAEDGMVWVKLGTFPDMTIEQARKAAEESLGEFAKGNNPAKARREEKQKITLGQAFQNYFDLHVRPRGVKTADDILAMWQRFLGNMPDEPARRHGRKRHKDPAGVDWSNRKIDQIEAGEVRTLHAAIGVTHAVTANRVIEILSAVYGRAIYLGYNGANPASKVEPFKEAKRDRFIQAEELPIFFTELANETSEDFKHFVLLCLLTGARRINVMSARWEDVNLAAAIWRIPDTDSKNGEPMTIPLGAEVVQIFEARNPKKSGFVFPAMSATGHMTPPKKRWQNLIKRCGIENLRIHDLRRSLGSWQAITGASLVIIGKSLGHKSAEATMIYARLNTDPVRASVSAATSAMLEAAGMKSADNMLPMRAVK
ncbi:MAG: site-specific integrase [Thiobacillaceae bacterium]